MERVNLFMPLRMLRALRKESKRSGLSLSEVIRRAVDEYLGKVTP